MYWVTVHPDSGLCGQGINIYVKVMATDDWPTKGNLLKQSDEHEFTCNFRKEKRDKACKLKWFEKEVKRSGEEKAWAEQGLNHYDMMT